MPISQYTYKPLLSPAQIRVLELIRSDEPRDPIHVKLHHVPLTEISKVETLSYEWGSPTRNAKIFCDAKTLKVTPNLVAALVRLRDRGPDPIYLAQEERVVLNVVSQETAVTAPAYTIPSAPSGFWKRSREKLKARAHRLSLSSTSSLSKDAPVTIGPESSSTKPSTYALDRSTRESYMLWIDAICINQDDTAERSQQVKLMGSIYSNARHVVIWTGEELPGNETKEVYDLFRPLVNQFRGLAYSQPYFDNDAPHPLESLLLNDGTRLGDFNQHRLKPAMLDLFASRTVFRRLWTLQEMVLAKEGQVTVQCGSVCIHWTAFYVIICTIMQCPFLQSAGWMAHVSIYQNVFIRYGMQAKHKIVGTTLVDAIEATSTCAVTDERDHVFGILGLVDDKTIAKFAHVSYQNSLRDILETLTKVLVLEENSLAHLGRNLSVAEEEEESGYPTWIWRLQEPGLVGSVSGVNKMEALQPFVDVPAVEFHGSRLTAWGLILDTVSFAYESFTQQNARQLLLDIYYAEDTFVSEAPNLPLLKKDRLWPLFSLTESAVEQQTGYDLSKGYAAMVADLTMLEFSQWLRDSQSGINSGRPSYLQGSIADSNVAWRGRTWSDMVVEISMADPKEHLDYVASAVMSGVSSRYGRNVFTSTRGYHGIGVYSHTYLGSKPAVQTGDKIVLFPQAAGPVILRPCEHDDSFTFVGPTFVPYILSDDLLRPDSRPPLQPIRIQ